MPHVEYRSLSHAGIAAYTDGRDPLPRLNWRKGASATFRKGLLLLKHPLGPFNARLEARLEVLVLLSLRNVRRNRRANHFRHGLLVDARNCFQLICLSC